MKLPIITGDGVLPSVSDGKRLVISKRGTGFDLLYDESGIRRKINTATATESGLMTDAPADGKAYFRRNGQWVELDALLLTPEPTPTPAPAATPIPTPTPTPTWYNVAKSAAYTRNNCGSGYGGSSVTYTVPAGKYSSTVSQADADSKAQADINANSQAYANSNGSCTYSGTPAPTPTPAPTLPPDPTPTPSR